MPDKLEMAGTLTALVREEIRQQGHAWGDAFRIEPRPPFHRVSKSERRRRAGK